MVESYLKESILADLDKFRKAESNEKTEISNRLKYFVDSELEKKYGKNWHSHKSEGCMVAIQILGREKNKIREILGNNYKIDYRVQNALKRKPEQKQNVSQLKKENDSLKNVAISLAQNLGMSLIEARSYVKTHCKF